MTDLDQLEALLAKATPGEWQFQTCLFDNYAYTLSAPAAEGNYSHVIADICLRDPAKANAALIVALRNAAPALIAKARRVDALEAALRSIASRTVSKPPAPGDYKAFYVAVRNAARAAIKANTDG